jgi:hypothetical protein
LGAFIPPLTFVSSSNQIIVVLRRTASPPQEVDNIEFIDGAFMFHDEVQSGTLQPASLCNSHHYGLSSPEFGSLDGPVIFKFCFSTFTKIAKHFREVNIYFGTLKDH